MLVSFRFSSATLTTHLSQAVVNCLSYTLGCWPRALPASFDWPPKRNDWAELLPHGPPPGRHGGSVGRAANSLEEAVVIATGVEAVPADLEEHVLVDESSPPAALRRTGPSSGHGSLREGSSFNH